MVFRVILGLFLNFDPFKKPQEFCDKEQCEESDMQLAKSWKLPVWVKNAQKSQVLQKFLQMEPLSTDTFTTEDLIEQCKKEIFKFPGLSDQLGSNHLERMDKRSDTIFYEQPRFVTHIDDFAIESLAKYYSEHLEINSKLVDLCSSWVSHLPKSHSFQEVIGIGMNEKELQKNPRLTKYYVHDLNKNPNLIKMVPEESVDAVLCAVSVDYLIRPFELFSQVHKILKPGGSFILSFSNRMFATKVISAWLQTQDPEHLFIATYYFQGSASWNKVIVSDITDISNVHRDPMYVVHGVK